MNDPYNQGGRSFKPPRVQREVIANSDAQHRQAAKILESAPPLMLVDDIENTGTRAALAALVGTRFTYEGA